MGTRSLTVMNDNDGSEIAVMYRQFDGYPTRHGAELAEFLKPIAIVNGLSGTSCKVANRGSCLAMQIISRFKTEPGGFYLHPAGTRNAGEEYVYTVQPRDDGKIYLKVVGGYGEDWKTLFDGNVEDFDPKEAQALERE